MSSRPADYPFPSSPAATATMKANRRVDTRPETRLRSALHQRGLRFRKDVLLRIGSLRTKADVVFTRARVVVYVDGCFWHCCPEHGQLPKANREYWKPKLARNVRRDDEVTKALRADEWSVIRVWEHESIDLAAQQIHEMIRKS